MTRLRSARHVTSATADQVNAVRRGIAELDPAAAASISGEGAVRPEDIFAPAEHIHALDPASTLVLGSRGAGKSFWASALAQDKTRTLTAALYPRLGLNGIDVKVGFSGGEDGRTTPDLVEELVPEDDTGPKARAVWRATVIHALQEATGHPPERISALAARLGSTEDWKDELEAGTQRLSGRRLLVLFDAIDALSTDWDRLRMLVDELLKLAWGLRAVPSVRVKLFLRPDQLDELKLGFVELSKMRAKAANLDWSEVDLYGMLFARLGLHEDDAVAGGFGALLAELRLPLAPEDRADLRDWPLSHDPAAQRRLFERFSGPYMGAGPRKGRTYDWPANHLADGWGEVTPRSFLILMQAAGQTARRRSETVRQGDGAGLVITPDGIRDGLRAASEVRVDQLAVEYPWVKRALTPLARLKVPNKAHEFYKRWRAEKTMEAIDRAAKRERFLPPLPDFENPIDREAALAARMIGMGLLTRREDGRIDMPDLFRVGAELLRKGGVPPEVGR